MNTPALFFTRSPAVTAILLIFFCVAVFYPAVQNEFVWDDRIFMLDAASYSDAGRIHRSLLQPFSLHESYYRPTIALSFAIIPGYLAFSAAAHHAINIAMLGAISVLVYLLTLRVQTLIAGSTIATREQWIGALVAAVCIAVHPSTFEPVLWISGRFDLAVAMFLLLFVYVDISSPLSWKRTTLLFVAFFLAATSKESAVAFPLAMVAIHTFFWKARRLPMNWLPYMASQRTSYLAILAAGGSYLALRYVAVGHLLADNATLALVQGAWDRAVIASLALGKYLLLVFLPWNTTAPLHPFSLTNNESWLSIAPLVAGFSLLAIAAYAFKTKALWPLVVVVFVSMLLPVMHILTFSAAGNLIADRYLLAPLSLALPFAMSIVVARTSLLILTSGFIWALRVAAFLVLLSWIALARVTTLVWHDDNTLWAYAYERAPTSIMATQNYVTSLLQRGKLVEGEKILRTLISSGSDVTMSPLTNLAMIRAVSGDFDDAFSIMSRVSRDKVEQSNSSDKSIYFCTYAQIYAIREAWKAALENSARALASDPSNSTCRVVEIRSLHALGLAQEATDKLAALRQVASPALVKKLDEMSAGWIVK